MKEYLKHLIQVFLTYLGLSIYLIISACSNAADDTDPDKRFKLQAVVEGLSGEGLILSVNDLPVPINSNGPNLLHNNLENNEIFSLSIQQQPTNPNQTCNLASSTVTIEGQDAVTSVTCQTNRYSVEGTLNIADNNFDFDLSLNGRPKAYSLTPNAGFKLTEKLPDHTLLDLTVTTPPNNQSCEIQNIENGNRTINGKEITDIVIFCDYTVAPVVADPDIVTGFRNETLTTTNVLLNDKDNIGDGTLKIVDWQPQTSEFGEIQYNGDATFTFVPHNNTKAGKYTFTYSIENSTGKSAKADIVFHVEPSIKLRHISQIHNEMDISNFAQGNFFSAYIENNNINTIITLNDNTTITRTVFNNPLSTNDLPFDIVINKSNGDMWVTWAEKNTQTVILKASRFNTTTLEWQDPIEIKTFSGLPESAKIGNLETYSDNFNRIFLYWNVSIPSTDGLTPSIDQLWVTGHDAGDGSRTWSTPKQVDTYLPGGKINQDVKILSPNDNGLVLVFIEHTDSSADLKSATIFLEDNTLSTLDLISSKLKNTSRSFFNNIFYANSNVYVEFHTIEDGSSGSELRLYRYIYSQNRWAYIASESGSSATIPNYGLTIATLNQKNGTVTRLWKIENPDGTDTLRATLFSDSSATTHDIATIGRYSHIKHVIHPENDYLYIFWNDDNGDVLYTSMSSKGTWRTNNTLNRPSDESPKPNLELLEVISGNNSVDVISAFTDRQTNSEEANFKIAKASIDILDQNDTSFSTITNGKTISFFAFHFIENTKGEGFLAYISENINQPQNVNTELNVIKFNKNNTFQYFTLTSKPKRQNDRMVVSDIKPDNNTGNIYLSWSYNANEVSTPIQHTLSEYVPTENLFNNRPIPVPESTNIHFASLAIAKSAHRRLFLGGITYAFGAMAPNNHIEFVMY